MTRAKNILVITWYGNGGSRFISEMDPSMYETEGLPFETGGCSSVDYTVRIKSAVKSSDSLLSVSKPDAKSSLSRMTTKIEQDSIAAITTGDKNLAGYLKSKGIEIVDKRSKGGALWAVGGKELDTLLNATRKEYGALWTFCKNGGSSTGGRASWFTKCNK